jgi:hypothetical protein
MRKSRFRDQQMAAMLREADATPVATAAKKHKVGEQAICSWRERFSTAACHAPTPALENMALRGTAAGLFEAEESFRKVLGFEKLWILRAALGRDRTNAADAMKKAAQDGSGRRRGCQRSVGLRRYPRSRGEALPAAAAVARTRPSA